MQASTTSVPSASAFEFARVVAGRVCEAVFFFHPDSRSEQWIGRVGKRTAERKGVPG